MRGLRWAINAEELSGVGGPITEIIAGGTLLIGDVVMVSAASTVNKSAVAANGAFFAGVVVGGGGDAGYSEPLGYENINGNIGLQATIVNKAAALQVAGIAFVKAGAAIAAGARVGFDTGTAGRVIANATAGQTIGIALTAALANGDIIKMLIQPR